MKILFQSYAFYPSVGGIESSAQLFIQEFIKAGHDIRIHTMAELGNHAEIETAPIKRKPTVRKRLEDIQWADVIYQHNPSLQLGWPTIFSSKPKVVSVRTWIRRSKTGRVSLTDQIKRRWIAQHSVISNSQATANHLSCDSTVIENAYDDSTFKITNSHENRRDLIFVGRLVRDKGCHTLIEALAKLNSSGRAHKLTIIGDGPEKDALIAQTESSRLKEHIHFMGKLPPFEVAKKLNKHKYHIIPSKWAEPFGIVALEGIACGCLPIGTNQGGLVDAIGECGPLVAAEDPITIANQIEQLEADPELYRQYISKHQHHLENHRPAFVAQRYLDLFEKARTK